MTKRATASAALFLVALVGMAQAPASVAGTWSLAYEVGGVSVKMTCVIAQQGGILSGTCTGDDKVAQALTGTVAGQAVSFKFDKAYEGSPITDSFSAPQGNAAGKMQGTMSVAPLSVSGTFTATKQ